MPTDYGFALQKAVFAAVDGAVSCTVYDYVPPNASLPFVVIDNQFARPDDPLASRRTEHLIYLTVWSKYEGQKEVLGFMADIDAVLHQQSLDMDAGRMVRAYVTRRETRRDVDGKTYMGMMTVRALVEHT